MCKDFLEGKNFRKGAKDVLVLVKKVYEVLERENLCFIETKQKSRDKTAVPCQCECVYVLIHVHACMRVCVCVRACVSTHVHALWECGGNENISRNTLAEENTNAQACTCTHAPRIAVNMTKKKI